MIDNSIYNLTNEKTLLNETPMVELARDEQANEWVDNNVPEQLAIELRRWARGMLDIYDADDQASVGVLLTAPCRPFDSEQGLLPKRAHVYSLIFQWDDSPAKVRRSLLEVNDANQVVGFRIVDQD